MNRINKRNKYYIYVEYALNAGFNHIPISLNLLHLLEKMMDKKRINYRRTWFERIKLRITFWWLIDNPWANYQMNKKYGHLSSSTYSNKLKN